MVDDFMVCVDRLIASACFEPGNAVVTTAGAGGDDGGLDGRRVSSGGAGGGGHELPVQQMALIEKEEEEEGCSSKKKQKLERCGSGRVTECRICQEEGDEIGMEAPCACSGTLKFAHRKCIQKWCNRKGNITCEICNQVYAPNHTIPPGRSNTDGPTIDIRQGWNQQIDFHDP